MKNKCLSHFNMDTNMFVSCFFCAYIPLEKAYVPLTAHFETCHIRIDFTFLQLVLLMSYVFDDIRQRMKERIVILQDTATRLKSVWFRRRKAAEIIRETLLVF